MKAMENRERRSAGQHQGAVMKKGWQTKRLGDVCAFDKSQGIHRGLPYVGLEHIESHTARFIGSSEPQPVKSSTFRFSDEHVLYGRLRPYLNKALAPDFEGHCSTEIFPLKPRPELSREYLLFWLLADETCDRINETCTGARMPRAQMNDVLSFEIPVPPLAEQQRIFGLLDEAFAGLATAKANAAKNLQNARALFESHLQSVFTQRGKGWVEKTFEELIESNIIGLTKNSREQGEDKAWPYVKMNNITRDNRFDFSRFTCVDATAEEVSKFSLKDGDFLFNTRNSHELVGKSCIYESDSNDAVLYNNNIMRVRFQRGIDARFVLLAFSSKGVADELNALKSGTTNVSAIYFKDLKSLVIPVPPIAEQKRIAAKLESLVAETQRLARLYERKLAALEALKKSLLHQAFTGEL
jgi:type I restriction enzyme S subunit